ncbi:MAG: hypothetical protein ABSC72_01605 [Methylovirgula sp.]|jgi:hypothetical protein
MVLTGAGYVPLGQEAPGKAGTNVTRFRKGNPYHDEQGLFTSADGAASGEGRAGSVQVASRDKWPPVRTAQTGEEDDRDRAEEQNDPSAEARQQQWGNAIQTLRALDPKNPNLSYIVPQDWVPSDQNIADINTEIANVATRRATDFIMPGGNLIGEQGSGSDANVRNLPDGAQAAQAAFDYLSVGGKPYAGSYSSSGKMVTLPGNVGWVGLRSNDQGIPTVDINLPATFGSIRIHYR